MTKDIDRPLGLGKESGIRTSAGGSRLGSALTGLVALAVLGGSAAIALRDRPFRLPEPTATSTPEVVAAAEPEAPDEPAPQAAVTAERVPPRSGPSILKVDPPDEEPVANGGVIVIRDPTAIGQDLRVAHLPDRALIEMSETGPLPVRAADGRRPMDVYARKWSGARGARVALVIGGLGMSQTGTQTAIDRLPPEITLGFAPQGNSLDRWMQTARRKGHEIVLQLPLEPFDYPSVNPGRNTLTVDADPGENLDRLRWALSRTTNYTGVMNYMGARFVADSAAMDSVMADLGDRGLLYLDDGTTSRSVAPESAIRHRVPFVAGDALIDGDRSRAAILKKLDELERTARAKGIAVGTGSAFDTTVEAVATWVAEARKRGIEIVPISALVADPEKS